MSAHVFNAVTVPENKGELIPSFPLAAHDIGIIVDIGGTNARFQLCDAHGPIGEATFYKTNDFASFDAVLRRYMEDTAAEDRVAAEAVALSLGAAGAVKNHTVKITNAPAWPEISASALKQDFPNLAHVCVVNDFVAIANAISVLDDKDLEPVEGGSRVAKGTVVVTGPGTGFGLSLIAHDPASGKEIIVPGEAGHNLIKALPKGLLRDITDTITELGHPGTLNRNLMTGRGLGLIYDALQVISDDYGHVLAAMNEKRAGQPHAHTDPAEVVKLAVARDPLAEEALRHFFTFVGRDIGSRIAESTATGGAFIAGGLMARCHEAFAENRPDFWQTLKNTLRKAADGHGPGNFSGGVGITIVLDELCGLKGLRKTLAFPAAPQHTPALERQPSTP